MTKEERAVSNQSKPNQMFLTSVAFSKGRLGRDPAANRGRGVL
jgi:hypothetical protein